jgi:hypothetical protein
MNACRQSRRAVRNAVGTDLFVPEGADKEHIAVCQECRREHEDLRAIGIGAEAVRDEIGAAMAGVDWDALSEQIADAALAERRTAPQPAPRPIVRPFFSRSLLAGAAAGLLVGVLATLFFLRRGPQAAALPTTSAASAIPAAGSYSASGEFLQRVELELAKRETIDYLEKSEYVLLDLLEPRSAGAAPGPPAAPIDRTSGLLAQKRYFNAHLDDVRMAKARALCDQIEFLFLELSQISRTLDPKETAEIRKYVEDKQLLLQIRLLKKELRENEA